MSGQQVSVDTDTMRPGMESFTDVGNQVTGLYYRLYNAAQQYSGCWGADSTGEQFAAGYLPSAEQVLTGMQTAGQSVLSVIQNIRTMIQGYTDTELGNIQASGFGDQDTGTSDNAPSDDAPTHG
jgi:hypothetical protein